MKLSSAALAIACAGFSPDEADKLREQGRAYCERETAAVEELRTRREKLARETEALRQSREASGR